MKQEMIRKCCTKCGVEYPRTREYFPGSRDAKDGLQSWCKKCSYTLSATWAKKNRKKCNEHSRKNYQKNREKYLECCKKYHQTLRGHISQLMTSMKHRCTNPKCKSYKYYGGRGIKCCFTADDLYDWLVTNNIDPRDKDIHRINNDGNYVLDNITFMNKSLHMKLHRSLRKT